MYNRVGGSGGILPRENLNFQNLRNAIFGLLAVMFALLQKLSLLNLQAIFLVTPPLHTIFFRLPPPPLKPYFFTWPPSNPTSQTRWLQCRFFCLYIPRLKVLWLFVPFQFCANDFMLNTMSQGPHRIAS